MTRIRVDEIIVSFDGIYGNTETAEELARTFNKDKNGGPVVVEIDGVHYLIKRVTPSSMFNYARELVK